MKAPDALRQPRGRRSGLSALVAVILTLAAAFVVVEAVYAAAEGVPLGFRASSTAGYGIRTPLGATIVIVVGVAVAVVGLLLLLAAVVPPRQRQLQLTQPEAGVAPALSRRSLQRNLSSLALTVDGVQDVKVTGKRNVRVDARTDLADTGGLRERISAVVTARVDELAPARPVRVRVRLSRKGG